MRSVESMFNKRLLENISDYGAIKYFGSDEVETFESLKKDIKKYIAYFRGLKKILLIAPYDIDWIKIYVATLSLDITFMSLDVSDPMEYIQTVIQENDFDLIISDIVPNAIPISELGNRVKPIRGDEGDSDPQSSVIMFTSGTTGTQKGIRMTTSQIIENTLSSNKKLRISRNDSLLLSLPFSHCMGQLILLCGLFGAREIVLANKTEHLLLALEKSNCNMTVLPPVILKLCSAKEKIIRKLSSYRCIVTGGAPLEYGLYNKLTASGVKVYNGYGATECVCGIAIADTNSSPEYGKLEPLDCCEIKLSECDEICVKGSCVCQEYTDGTPIVNNEWYHTKDIGKFDTQGNLFILGRLDNVIVMNNGYKIVIEDVENKILSHYSAIKDCRVSYHKDKNRDFLELSVVSERELPKDFLFKLNETLPVNERIFRVERVSSVRNHRGKIIR